MGTFFSTSSTSPPNSSFSSRIEWDLADFRKFEPVAQKFEIQWQLAQSSHHSRVALFVSKYDHCLVDLLYRWHIGELHCEIGLIMSNHHDAKRHADFYHLPCHVIPFTKQNKPEAERQELELLRAHDIELLALARYTQVLCSGFIGHYPL